MTALVTTFAALVFVGTACSNNGEGERCESENGNDDCKTDEGLICYPKGQLNTNADRCCPADRTKATHPICKAAVSIATDATTPADTGPAPVSDAAGESDAADAASDADAESDASDASDQ